MENSVKKRTFMRASLLYLIGNVFEKAIGFLTLPLFARLLTTEENGVVGTYLSWVSLFTVIISLSLANSVRTAINDFPGQINKYISSIYALGTFTGFIITGIVVLGAYIFVPNISTVMVLLCCLQAFFNSVISAVQIKCMMEVKYVQKSLLQILPNIIIVALSVVLVKYINAEADKYWGRIIAYALVLILLGIVIEFRYLFIGRTGYNKTYWKYGLAVSLPLIFHSISNVVLAQSDRTMISALYSVSETGIYGIAYQFGMIPLVMTHTLENIWIPWFTTQMNHGNKSGINKMANRYVFVLSIACSGVMIASPEVLKFMTTSDYYSGVYMVPPIIIGIFFMFLTSIPLDLEYYKKDTKTIAVNTMVSAIVNIILNVIFIPQYGGIAAAYTTAVSYGVSLIMHYRVSRKIDRELFGPKLYIIPTIGISVVLFVTLLLMDYPIVRWILAFILLAVFICFGISTIGTLKQKEE